MAGEKPKIVGTDPVSSRPGLPPARRDPAATTRRGALGVLVSAGGCAYAAALLVPVAGFVAASGASSGSGGERWIRVGRLDALPEAEPRRVAIVADQRDAFTITRDERLGAVWVVRDNDAVRALSATCPHLGCAVDLADDKKSFACPCHASKFSPAGDVESGPSPRAMDALRARVVDGFVEIDFRRFRQGISGREEMA